MRRRKNHALLLFSMFTVAVLGGCEAAIADGAREAAARDAAVDASELGATSAALSDCHGELGACQQACQGGIGPTTSTDDFTRCLDACNARFTSCVDNPVLPVLHAF